jgi:hypothetical protein
MGAHHVRVHGVSASPLSEVQQWAYIAEIYFKIDYAV